MIEEENDPSLPSWPPCHRSSVVVAPRQSLLDPSGLALFLINHAVAPPSGRLQLFCSAQIPSVASPGPSRCLGPQQAAHACNRRETAYLP